jgi:hypothetical protein
MAEKEATRLLGPNPKPERNNPPMVFLVRPGTDANGYQRFVTFSFVPTPEVQGQKCAEPVYKDGVRGYNRAHGYRAKLLDYLCTGDMVVYEDREAQALGWGTKADA